MTSPDDVANDVGNVVQRVVALGRAARNESGLKVRQPLSRLLARVPDEAASRAVERHGEQIRDELNIKSVEIVPRDAELGRVRQRRCRLPEDFVSGTASGRPGGRSVSAGTTHRPSRGRSHCARWRSPRRFSRSHSSRQGIAHRARPNKAKIHAARDEGIIPSINTDADRASSPSTHQAAASRAPRR